MRVNLITLLDVHEDGTEWDRFWLDIIGEDGALYATVETDQQTYAGLLAARNRETERFSRGE